MRKIEKFFDEAEAGLGCGRSLAVASIGLETVHEYLQERKLSELTWPLAKNWDKTDITTKSRFVTVTN